MDNLNLIEKAYLQFNEETWRRKGQLDNINKTLAEKKHYQEEIAQEIYLYRQVNAIYQEAAEFARNKAKERMENLVTNALDIIFPGDLSFNIELEGKEDKTEAYFTVASTYGGEHIIKNEPQEARGGGIVDIISLALRVALMETSRPALTGALILDEPAKHVSGDYSHNVAEFLNLIVKDIKRQVIMVTHNNYLADSGQKAFEVKIEQGVTLVTPR